MSGKNKNKNNSYTCVLTSNGQNYSQSFLRCSLGFYKILKFGLNKHFHFLSYGLIFVESEEVKSIVLDRVGQVLKSAVE